MKFNEIRYDKGSISFMFNFITVVRSFGVNSKTRKGIYKTKTCV